MLVSKMEIEHVEIVENQSLIYGKNFAFQI